MNERIRGIASSLAGPLLILGSSTLLLRDHVFRGLIDTADLLSMWLPTYCFLGRSLAAGHIPGWNPHVMAGVPFAADPQSGWLNVPVMAFFTLLPCGVAIRLMVLFQPVLGGIGVYLFLRTEGLSRPAATAGGVVLALGIAGSALAAALPFSATLAWTAVLLFAAARAVRAITWPRRLLWILAGAIAWGQVAAAFFTAGLAIGTGALLAYLGVTMWGARRHELPVATGTSILLLAALVPVNLAGLLPRLEYLPRTTLGLGYGQLSALNGELSGSPPASLSFAGASPAWPLNMALSPGVYLGAIALVLGAGALFSRRHRALAIGFAAFGLLSYLGSLEVVARNVGPLVGGRLGDVYRHAPGRLGLALVLAVAILAAVGLQAWMDSRSIRDRALLVAPGLLLWAAVPVSMGAPIGGLGAFAVGIAAGAAVLAVGSRWPGVLSIVPAVLVGELLLGAEGLTGPSSPRVGFDPRPPNTGARPPPTAEIERYLEGGPIGRTLPADGRYALTGDGARQELAQPIGVGSLNEAIVLGAENAGGYNSVQLQRYWAFVRAVQGRQIIYNRAYFLDLSPVAADLLQIRAVVAPADDPPPPGAHPIRRQGGWILYDVDGPDRATLVAEWSVVSNEEAAREAVLDPMFDPGATAVLEADPGPSPAPAPAPNSARVDAISLDAQSARFRTRSDAPAVLLVRSSFDRHWRAAIDGRSSQVLVADSFLQGVAVPPGAHSVDLEYDDPWIGYGLLGSGLAIAALLAAATVLGVRSKRSLDAERTEAPGVGLEPTTLGLTGPRSAD